MNKCIYCNRKSENLSDFAVASGNESEKQKGCSNDCISKATSYLNYTNKHAKLFWLAIAFSLALAFMGVFFDGIFFDALTAVGVFLLGVTAISFPFATPQTVYFFGIRISKMACRVLGLAVIAGSFYNAYGLLANILA